MLNETEYAELENVTIDFVVADDPKAENPLKRRESKIIYSAIMKSECKNPEILHSQINAAFKTTQSKLNFFDAQAGFQNDARSMGHRLWHCPPIRTEYRVF